MVPLGDLDFTRCHVLRRSRTTVNGVLNSDLQQNWRVGATLALPVNRENSIKFYASKGVSARTGDSTGDSYDLIGVAWQYRFGGGL